MIKSDFCNAVFETAIRDYHLHDSVDAAPANPYECGSIGAMLYQKCWIDAVQWHLEDIIRDPDIDPALALAIKRRIDASNQARTDMVEQIDSYFLDQFRDICVRDGAGVNTESPAWAIDRLSILALKIYHMREQTERQDAGAEHLARCRSKLAVLLEQRQDLSQSIDTLLADLGRGEKRMKTYLQMKMYNDRDTNPVLYAKDEK